MAGLLFVVAGLGLTCEEYLDLPSAQDNASDVYRANGFSQGRPYSVRYTGDIEHNAWWLGRIVSGELVDGAFYEVADARMRVGALQADLDRAQIDYFMSVRLNVFGWDADKEDWNKLNDDEFVGAARFPGGLVSPPDTEEECPVGVLAPLQGGGYAEICGIANLKLPGRAANLHVHAPFGDLLLFFQGELPGSCTGCSATWRHLIP